MADPENRKYDIFADASAIVDRVDASWLYSVPLQREIIERVTPWLFMSLGIFSENTSQFEATNRESDIIGFSIAKKFIDVSAENIDDETVNVDLTTGEMDYLNTFLEESARRIRHDVDQRPMAFEDREYWKDRQPESYATLLKTLRTVNKAFQKSGAPPRPLYLKYFEGK